MTKDIVIMAKSTKHYPNYCIAGIDIENGEWIRPVSDDVESEGAVLKEDAIYKNGMEVEILDVVRIKFVKHIPNDAQKENYLYDSEQPWEKIGEMSLQEVIDKYQMDNHAFVFVNTNNALYDKELTGDSLLFLQVQNPYILVNTFPERKNITVNFTYNNNTYRYISIGNINLKNPYRNLKDGKYDLGQEKLAVFSLTGQHKDGKYYKMLAQLF